jgi:hypothetical protein
MSCDTCGTIYRYGKRVKAGKKLCIDCWKTEDKKDRKKRKDSPSEE